MAPAAAHTATQIESAVDLKSFPPFWKRKNGIILYLLLTSSLLSSMASGFDGSMTNAMQLSPKWQNDFGHPTGSRLGLFGASTAIGGVIPLMFLNWISDAYGRRLPTFLGSVIIIGAAILEAFAKNLNTYIGGKVLLGFGCSIVQMGAPVLVTELSHPKERAMVTSFYNTSVLLGYVVGAWITFGTVHISGAWQWKLPTILQAVPSIYQLVLIYFCPESPRWLVATGRKDQAHDILIKYHGGCDPASELVAIEFEEIKSAIMRDTESSMTWRDFFGNRANLKRIMLCTAVGTFSQTTGNLLVSNFLGEILKDTGLRTTFQSTLINGMITLTSYITSILVAAFFDRFRRRTFFLTGCGGSLIVFIVWTISSQQYADRGSLAAGRLVIACIFLYQIFYTIAWLNLVVAWPLELVPYNMRAKTWSYVLLVIFASQIFGNYVNPIALEHIAWKWYIYHCIWITCVLTIVYFFFVETQGPTLEELALLFEDDKAGIATAALKEAGIRVHGDGDGVFARGEKVATHDVTHVETSAKES